MAYEQGPIDRSVIEELYTEYPVAPDFWKEPEMIHPASSTDNPTSPLFIAKRNPWNGSTGKAESIVDLDGRFFWPGFEYLNQQALEQHSEWRFNMYNNPWFDEREYPSLPMGHEAEVLAVYSLAYWAHAVQGGNLTLSMHASDKFGGKDHAFARGFVLLNQHTYGMLSSYDPSQELRDVVSALQAGFGLPTNEIARNIDQPFPRRNVWDIPGGKMLVVPENYNDVNAGVVSLRLVPENVFTIRPVRQLV